MADDTTTLEAQMEQYRTEHRKLLTDHRQTYQLLGGLLVLLLGIWIGSQRYSADTGFETNLYTELLSIGVTILVLNWFADRRARNQRKQELLLQLSSPSNDFALEASRQLDQLGWLEDGTLSGTEFSGGNLKGAKFLAADLSRTWWIGAHFEKASLSETKFNEASFTFCFFNDTDCWRVDFENAVIASCVFRGANLIDANMCGARFDEGTILPDGKPWTPDTDMTRFTDPDHPQFWRSDDSASPACHGGALGAADAGA